jgi:hypothetical protein
MPLQESNHCEILQGPHRRPDLAATARDRCRGESDSDVPAEGESGDDVLAETVVDGIGGAATAEERPSVPSVQALIHPYPRSSACEGGLPSPCSPDREGRRRRRWGGDGRREQGSPPVGDREGRGTWAERGGM